LTPDFNQSTFRNGIVLSFWRKRRSGSEAGMFLLWIIIVGLIAGWATGKIMKGSGYGVLTDILLGIVGAIVGSRLLGLLGIYTSGGLIPSILVAIFGAVVIVALVHAIKKV
jgi:uncharacterized membrane protein YeaQ/YmgE (transglycosylase-associated protein family)